MPPARSGSGTWGRPAAVLFDLDGTLIDSRRLYLEAYRRALTPALGRPLSDAEILAARPRSERRFLVGQILGAARAHEAAGIEARVEPAVVDACLADFYRAYGDLHDRLFGGEFPGIDDTLRALRADALRLGIVTGKSTTAWDITRTRVDLGPFDVLVFDDDVAHPKPDPEGLRLALDRLRLVPRQAVYVGDTMGDVKAARAAGTRAIAVTWARPPERRADFARHARDAGASVAEDPAELLRLLY